MIMRALLTGIAGAFVALAREISALHPALLLVGMLLGVGSVAVLSVFLN